jgi:hypothetical protein
MTIEDTGLDVDKKCTLKRERVDTGMRGALMEGYRAMKKAVIKQPAQVETSVRYQYPGQEIWMYRTHHQGSNTD